MAWVSLRDAVVSTTIERLSQNIVAFNAASNGGIVLSNPGNIGDFVDAVMFGAMETGARRDRTTGAAAAAPTEVPQVNNIKITVNGRFGPYDWNLQDPQWQGMADSATVDALATRLSDYIMLDQLNTGAGAAVGAIANADDTFNDLSAVGVGPVATYVNLNNTFALLGDASMQVACICCNGAVYHQLVGDALGGSKELFDYQGIRVTNFMGKIFVIFDAPAFTVAAAALDYNTLILNEGGVMIEEQGAPAVAMPELTGENITRQFQGDYSYQLGIKGMAYGLTANPTDAELFDGANWAATYSNAKAGPGALLRTNQTTA